MILKVTTILVPLYILAQTVPLEAQVHTLGRLQEVFAWKQITFNINGNNILEDRFREVEEDGGRRKRNSDKVVFQNDRDEPERPWDQQRYTTTQRSNRPWSSWNRPSQTTERPSTTMINSSERSSTTQRNNEPWSSWNRPSQTSERPSTTTVNPSDEVGRFFIQYNNLPMGVERVGDRLFVTLPRRRYGVPSTLNYLDLREDSNTRSPGLRPYPDLRTSRSIISVYRTRADECGRLWMVDTGMLEIPNNRQQLQPPAIVIFDLSTNRQILRYPFKTADIPAAHTPTGLASITVDITNGDCAGAYAYIPDLATYGLLVYSLRDGDSWRLTHNYFNFNPIAGNLRLAGQQFQWSDGIFSVTLTEERRDGCRTAYFHPMVGTHEFAVSTCLLKNRTASSDSNYWAQYSLVGDRGSEGQCTMHGYHSGSKVIFFANIGRDAVTCWNTGSALTPASVEILATDSKRLSYPSDLHVTGDEVWVMANSLPTFAYSRLDVNEYNFFIYKANVQELISGTVCEPRSPFSSG